MPNHQTPTQMPNEITKIEYWKSQLHFLTEPGVLVIVMVAVISTWHIAGWHTRGVLEAKQAELALLKSQLNASVNDANKAIYQIRKLGLALAAPVLDEMATDKLTMGYHMSTEDTWLHLQAIVSRLEELGASPKEVENIRINIDKSITRELRNKFIREIRDENKRSPELFDNMPHVSNWEPADFEKYISENNLKITPAINNYLSKLKHYSKYRELP